LGEDEADEGSSPVVSSSFCFLGEQSSSEDDEIRRRLREGDAIVEDDISPHEGDLLSVDFESMS